MISKKRYWGLALPIYVCEACGTFEVIGSETELHERAVEGWEEFEGHTPHRPWVDAVKIACSKCGAVGSAASPMSAIPGWTPASCPFSTLHYRHDREYWREWFPADFITESFPGQFRNWFYSHAGDGRRAGRYRAVQNGAGLRHAARPERRGDAQEQGQQHPLRRGGRTSSAPIRCAGSTSTTRRNRICASRVSQPRRRPQEARARASHRASVICGCRRAPRSTSSGTSTRSSSPMPTSTSSTRRRARLPVSERSDLDRWVLSELAGRRLQRGRPSGWIDFDAETAADGARRLHRESLELVCAPQPPPLLEERRRRRQVRRLSDAL